MTKVYFENGKYARHEGGGFVDYHDSTLMLSNDDFKLFGNVDFLLIHMIGGGGVFGSLDAKSAITNNHLSVHIQNSKAENINNADLIMLWGDGSLSNSSTGKLVVRKGNYTIDGTTTAKTVKFDSGTLSIAKNAVLIVSDKNYLNFLDIYGEGKVFDEKTQTYYNTDGHALYSNSIQTNITTHSFAMAKAIEKEKELKATYINTDKQNTDVDLLNIEAINNDNFLWIL